MSSFDQLKHDLFFHEKRLGLLLRRQIADDVAQLVNEINTSRSDCKKECEEVMQAMESSIVDRKMRGLWNEIRVTRDFAVELDLPHLVTASQFRAPEKMDEDAVVALVKRICDAARSIPDIVPNAKLMNRIDAEKNVGVVEAALRNVKWSALETQTLRESMSAHVTLLEDLSFVMQQLQKANFDRSKLRSRKEQLKLKEEELKERGEMDLVDGVVQEYLKTNDELLNLELEKVKMLERAHEDNLTRYKSNLNMWKSGASRLEVCRDERVRRLETCNRDLGRLDRGFEYHKCQYQKVCEETARHKDRTVQSLKDYSHRQEELTERLKELQREVVKVETELQDIAGRRAESLKTHVEVLEQEAQDRADFEEFESVVNAHRKHVEATRTDCQDGINTLDILVKFLLNDQSFQDYDFHAIAKKVKEMVRRSVVELQTAFHEHYEDTEQKKHKLGLQLRKIEESMQNTEFQLEICRESLDPKAKQHVISLKELQEQRASLEEEIVGLDKEVVRYSAVCEDKVREAAPGFVELGDQTKSMIEWKAIAGDEDRLDRREEVNRPYEDHVIGERTRVETSHQYVAQLLERESQSERAAGRVKQLRSEIAAIRAPSSIPVTIDVQPTTSAVVAAVEARRLAAQEQTKAEALAVEKKRTEPSAAEKMMSYREGGPRRIGGAKS